MLLHMEDDVKVARRTAESADLAVSRESNARAVLDARRNLGFDGSLAKHAAIAFALRAGIGNDRTRPLAGWAGARDRKEALLIANLALPVTSPAGHRGFARRSPSSAAGLTGFVAAHRDLGFGPKDRLLEFQVQILAKVCSTLRAGASPATAAAEQIAEAEKFSEDIGEILESAGIKTARARTRRADTGMAKTVVERPFLGIDQDTVGFSTLLELLFGVRIVGVPVWMVLESQLAIRALDLLLAGGAGYTQHLVVIALAVTGQNSVPSFSCPACSCTACRRRNSCSLVFGIAGDFYHGGPQQAVFQLVAALQFLDHLVVRSVGRLHEFNRLVLVRVELLTLRRDRAYA